MSSRIQRLSLLAYLRHQHNHVILIMAASSDLVHQPDIGPGAGPIYKYDQACIVLREEKFTDFVVQCGEIQFHVQRAFLYYKSTLLRTAVDNSMNEGHQGVLVIHDAKPRTVAILLLYCYTNTLTRPGIQAAWPKTFASTEDLADDAPATIRIQDWCEVYQLAGRFNLRYLRYACALACTTYYENMNFDFPDPDDEPIVRYIYATLPVGDYLRSVLTAVMFKRTPGNGIFWRLAREHDAGVVMALHTFKCMEQEEPIPVGFRNTMNHYIHEMTDG
jgi:hypothetical protein